MTEDYFPEPGKPGRRMLLQSIGRVPRAGLIAGVVAFMAVGGAGIAFAASSGSPSSATSNAAASSSSSTTVPGNSGKVHMPGLGKFRRGFGPFARGGLGGPLVHGQGTIRSGSGFKSVEFQTGTVTSVSSTSITVKSADGYTHTYAVAGTTEVNAQAGGISSVAKNDQVSLIASQVNGTDTATSIVDVTKIQGSRKAFGFAPPASNNGAPAPGTSGFGPPGGFGGPGGGQPD